MRARAFTLAAVVALLLVGCASSGTTNASNAPQQPPSGGPAPQSDQQAFAKLRSCLRKHGVTLPNGAPQGQPPSGSSKLRKAMQACGQYLLSQPQGGFGG
jgi:hypothetical protein